MIIKNDGWSIAGGLKHSVSEPGKYNSDLEKICEGEPEQQVKAKVGKNKKKGKGKKKEQQGEENQSNNMNESIKVMKK